MGATAVSVSRSASTWGCGRGTGGKSIRSPTSGQSIVALYGVLGLILRYHGVTVNCYSFFCLVNTTRSIL